MIQHEIFRVESRIPHYISCYIAESRFPLGQCRPIFFLAVYNVHMPVAYLDSLFTEVWLVSGRTKLL